MQSQMKSARPIARGAMAALFIGGMIVGTASAITLSTGEYEETRTVSCSTASCNMGFTQVPVLKNLFITNISCRIIASNPSSIADAILASSTSSDGPHFVPVLTAASASGKSYLANSPVAHIVPAFSGPLVKVNVAPGTLKKLDCTIAGKLQ